MAGYFKQGLLYSTVIASCLIATHAQAQQQPPSSADPGIVIRETGRERPQPSAPEDVMALPDTDVQFDSRETEKIFTLKGVRVEGGTVYSQQQIDALVGDMLGQMASFADLNEIARRLTVRYREDGFMFSRVVVTPQTIEDGIVRFQAIEGRITEVTVEGEYDDHFDLIEKMARKIESEGPSNTKELERYLLLIDDLPGIRARSLLRPSETQGGGELVITIEQDDAEASLGIDNRGSRFLGRHRGTAVAAFNSLFNVHDRTSIRGIMSLYANQTNELRFFDITHEQQVGTDGLRLSGRVASTSTNPGGSIANQNIEGNSQLMDISLLYPLVRSRDFNVNLTGSFQHLDSESDVAGIEISEDRVRTVTAGARVDFFDSYAGINLIDFEIAKGVDVFGATDDGLGRSRVNGEHEFLRAYASATRIQDLWWQNWSAYMSVAGQYAFDPLLASEEFALGGPVYGRGYDAGEVAGDHGWAGILEVRYGEPVAHEWISSYQLFGFYDIGSVWNEGNIVGEEDRDSLASAGAGARFNLRYDLSGSLEVAKPLTHNVNAEGSDGDEVRMFFNLLKRF